MLVAIGAGLEFPSVTLGIVARDGLTEFLVVVPLSARPMVSASAAAFEHFAILRQLVEIKGLHLFRRVGCVVLGGDNLQAEAHGSDIDVGSVLVAIRLGPGRSSGINRYSVVRRRFAGIDLQVGKGSLYIDLLGILVLVVNVDRAGGEQHYQGSGHQPRCCSAYEGCHSDPPLNRCAGLLRPAPRTEMLGMVTGMWPDMEISPNIALTALISETCILENVQKYVSISGNWE